MEASTTRKKFRPGEMAPITGVYLVTHSVHHRESHEVVIIRGEPLPACRECKLNVGFEILRPISHITHDWDFSGPHTLTVRPNQDDFKDTRMFRRVNIQWPVTVELSDSSNDLGVVQGHSIDLSAGGMGAVIRGKLPSRYKTGPVKILVDTGEESLTFSAQFRYQTGLRYGFEFASVNSGEKEALRRLMESQFQKVPDILC